MSEEFPTPLLYTLTADVWELVSVFFFISMKAKIIYVKPEMMVYMFRTDSELLAVSQGGGTDPWKQGGEY